MCVVSQTAVSPSNASLVAKLGKNSTINTNSWEIINERKGSSLFDGAGSVSRIYIFVGIALTLLIIYERKGSSLFDGAGSTNFTNNFVNKSCEVIN